MMLLQLVIAALNLYLTGRVPKILLVAKAHAPAPDSLANRLPSCIALVFSDRSRKPPVYSQGSSNETPGCPHSAPRRPASDAAGSSSSGAISNRWWAKAKGWRSQ
eukprot:6843199-Prymnesium_polylepis.1